MMLILTLVIALVATGRQLAALLFSAGFYLLARHYSDIFSFQAVHGGEGVGANWGAWQLLFVLSFLVGWNWSAFKIEGVVKRHTTALVVLLFVALLSSHYLRGSGYGPYLAASWFEKTQMGFGRIVYAFAIMAGLYALTRLLNPYLSRVFSPVALVGRRSLDAYVLQAIMLSGLVILPFSWASAPNVYLACVVFLSCYVWAKVKLASK